MACLGRLRRGAYANDPYHAGKPSTQVFAALQPVMLTGRSAQCRAVDELLGVARAGRSGTLVVRGEAGIGKTALLDYAVAAAAGFRVQRAVAVESELEMAYATAHQLCGRLADGAHRLPDLQADAIRTAFGMRDGPPPNPFLVGLALLGLLAEAAAQRPLLCVVDDAQWLDKASAQVLAFAARRLDAESVVIMFGRREPAESPELAGLPSMLLGGLNPAEARHLLAATMPGLLDDQVLRRIVAETGGNPLALLELSRGMSAESLSGQLAIPKALMTERIERSFLHRIAALPTATRRLMLLAAAEPSGDPVLLWRAAERAGLAVSDAEPAETAGLLRVHEQVAFRHPLVRSALYGTASGADRCWAHGILVQVIDPQADPDRWAWHRALAAAGPAEPVAAALENSAGRAQARGGLAAMAAMLERSAILTPDAARRGRRALSAAQAKHLAGMPEGASRLVALAEAEPLEDRDTAQLTRLKAQLTYYTNRGGQAPGLLLESAAKVRHVDPDMAREIYLEAFEASAFAGRNGIGARQVALAANSLMALPGEARPSRPADLLLEALVARFGRGYEHGVKAMREATLAFAAETDIRWLWIAATAAVDRWDEEAWCELAGRQADLAREAGALAVLPFALNSLAGFKLIAGDFAAAAALVQEADTVSAATGNTPIAYALLALAAWQGRDAAARELIGASIRYGEAHGEGAAITLARYAQAVLSNGRGRYADALAAAELACDYDELGFGIWGAPELVEAAVRCGQPHRASGVLGWLSSRAQASGTAWGLGLAARSRALVSEGETADDCYTEAIGHLGRTRMATDLARAHLLYGEWLRRGRRRTDARVYLQQAYDAFTSMGAVAFAARAAGELRACGATVRRATAVPSAVLTAQEARIAALACDGMSNVQIASRLFISNRTVEYHLRKVFTKLSISSRNQLHRVLSDHPELVRQLPPRCPRRRTALAPCPPDDALSGPARGVYAGNFG